MNDAGYKELLERQRVINEKVDRVRGILGRIATLECGLAHVNDLDFNSGESTLTLTTGNHGAVFTAVDERQLREAIVVGSKRELARLRAEYEAM